MRASKQEQMLQELQRDVAELQAAVKTVQRSQDEKSRGPASHGFSSPSTWPTTPTNPSP